MKNIIDSSLESLVNMSDIKDQIEICHFSEFSTDTEADVGLSHHSTERGS